MAANKKDGSDAQKAKKENFLEAALMLFEPGLLLKANCLAGLSEALAALKGPAARPGSKHQQMSASLGQALARHRLLDEVVDLVGRGWGLALFPAERWDEDFDTIASCGAKGYACLDALDAAGVNFFGGHGNLDSGVSPLCSAAKRLDGKSLAYFLAKMESQASPCRALHERGRLAAQALGNKDQRALVAPLIKENPKDWAKSLDSRGDGALSTCLSKGLLELASAMLEADPESIELVDPTRCAFSSKPLETLDLIVKHGVDLNKRGSQGASALHTSIYAGKHSQCLAAKLVKLGASPSARDNDGATPIGYAMAYWTWSDMKKTLGATPRRLMDSKSKSSTHGVGIVRSLIDALGQVKFSEKKEGGEMELGADERMAEIIIMASEDPRARNIKFIEDGLMACADHGLPSCLMAFAEIGAKHGATMRAELLASAVDGLPMGEAQEAGRMSCLKLAQQMGVDLNEPYPARGAIHKGKSTTLIEQALDGAVCHSEPRSNYFEPMARRARFLVELGCDPSGSKGDEDDWSFDVHGIGRKKLSARARQEFVAIDALLEAQVLQRSVAKTSTSQKKKGSLRV